MAADEGNVWDLGPAPAVPDGAAAPAGGQLFASDGSPSGAGLGQATLEGVLPPAVLPAPSSPSGVPPAAMRVFEELLNPPADRPVAPADAADQIRAVLDPFAAEVARVWPEKTLRVGKSQLVGIRQCEGAALAARLRGYSGSLPVPVMVGQVVHKAVQMLWTHPGHTLPAYVRAGVSGCADDSDDFAQFWVQASMATQSDVLAKATARLASFSDTFPPLLDEWSPRFEEPVSARVGPLVMVGRPDFMLGRPRPNGVRTMVVCDVKSGELHDNHRFEALLYAMLLTLRHGVPPWRSTVLSLASGEWTDPDFTVDELCETALQVGQGAAALAAVWSESRPPELMPGVWCRWCPLVATCSAAAAEGFGSSAAVTVPPPGPPPAPPPTSG